MSSADEDDALPVAEWRNALFEQIARADIQAAMASVDSLVTAPDDRRYRELRPQWRRVRTLFSALLQRITLDATPAGQPVVAALNYLRGVDDWTRARMTDAPTAFLGAAWKRHALDSAGRVADNRAYVFAALEAFRAGLKRRDVFVPAGVRYADPRQGLLSGEAWNAARLTVCRSLDRSPDAEAEIGDLTARLDRAWRQVAANLPKQSGCPDRAPQRPGRAGAEPTRQDRAAAQPHRPAIGHLGTDTEDRPAGRHAGELPHAPVSPTPLPMSASAMRASRSSPPACAVR